MRDNISFLLTNNKQEEEAIEVVVMAMTKVATNPSLILLRRNWRKK
jgi:hypothetical protein